MNGNPEDTPNPLNPNPVGASPTEPMQPQPVRPMRPMRRPMQTARSMDISRPINVTQATETVETTQAAGGTPIMTEEVTSTTIESLDPNGRPMEQAPVYADKPKKKRTGLIIGITIAVLALLGGGVAAAVILLTQGNQGDAVAAAMSKIMSGNTPVNVAVDGSIEMRSTSDLSPIETIRIDLDSDMVKGSMVNTSSAVVTLSIKNMKDISFEFDEVYAESGDLYLKLDGATNALEDSGLLNLLGGMGMLNTTTTNCTNDDGTNCTAFEVFKKATAVKQVSPIEDCDMDEDNCLSTEVIDCEDEDDCLATYGGYDTTGTSGLDLLNSLPMILSVIETIDGEWLRISTEELSLLSPDGMLPNSEVSCITDLVSNVNTNSTSAAELYAKYPFIKSSSENVALAKKKDPIYKVSIDSENFAGFINSIQNSQLSSSVYDCLGWSNNVSISTDDVEKVVNEFPAIYAEVDSDNNFTRLYLESDNAASSMTTIIDLSFNYPDTLNIEEPNDYTDFSVMLQQIMSSMYNLDFEEETEESVEEIIEEPMVTE